MAAQTAFARGADAHNRTGSTASTSLSYPPAPPSPTLTNPDMILPDYDRSDSPDERSQSPIMLWNNGQISDLQFHFPLQSAFVAGPITPTTPIIYGNGTMLSDIGEVTEVESTVDGRSRRASRVSDRSDDDVVLSAAPKRGETRIKRRSQIVSRARRSSVDSVSTVKSQGRAIPFADFDDSVSVDDSNFQGDDEESMASSYVEGTLAQESGARSRLPYQGANNEDRYSTYSLSQRAEEILANAKRRLTTMEGNLSRARSSLSQSSASDGSTPSPLFRPPTAMRDVGLATPSGHSRNLSENSLSANTKTAAYPQRSASALGAAGGYRQPLMASRSADALGARSAHQEGRQSLDPTIEHVAEDDEASNIDSRRSSAQFQPFLSPTFGSHSDKGLTRSASVAQMRDLKGQMNDLKGKISSLKEQARADSMKRRSLQTLRTPSPFTHARWDQGFMEPQDIRTPDLGGSPLNSPPLNEEPLGVAVGDAAEEAVAGIEEGQPSPMTDDYVDAVGDEETREESNQPGPVGALGIIQPRQEEALGQVDNEDEDDMQTEIGDVEDDEEWEEAEQEMRDLEGEQSDDVSDYVSESGDSLYHETSQHPISHEDREDAFDYEHFFLHSAMGTLSQHRSGRRRDSLSSEDSVETTRGPITSHSRKPSVDTISSFDSFATADEGRASRGSAVEDEQTKDAFVSASTSPDIPPASSQATSEATRCSRPSSAANHDNQPRRGSVIHRPASSSAVALHRPSVSSFESAGTNRSFPLVNKARMNGGVLTPGGSPDHELKQISEMLMNDTASICEKDGVSTSQSGEAIQMLHKEDQFLVERLVASLGKCVLGLGEGSRASTESRAYRRRMDAARRILEGLDES